MASSSSSTSLFSLIPTSIFRDCICPYLSATDLLSIRRSCSKGFAIFHQDETDSEEFWQRRLQHDFGFQKSNNNNHFQTLNICTRQQQLLSKSIFGIDPVNGDNNNENALTRVSTTAFDSWKTWLKSKRRFYKKSTNNTASNTQQEHFVWVDARPFQASYFLRAANIWNNIYKWCRQLPSASPSSSSYSNTTTMGTRILQELKPGLHYFDWPGGENDDDNDGPSAFRNRIHLHAVQALFAFCGSQANRISGFDYSFFEYAFDGLLGGYQAYGYYSCSNLVCIPTSYPRLGNIVLVGDCFLSKQQGVLRTLYVQVDTGRFYFVTQNYMSVPVIHKTNNNDNYDDEILVLLEYHTNRLLSGEIGLGVMGSHPNDPQAITLFPRFPTNVPPPTMTEGIQPISRAVVRGVEIVASAVYVPQGKERFGFIYSIRIRLLTPADNNDEYQSPEERGFQTCQLHMRHWRITDNTTGHTDNVSGPGVIGMYPVLYDGGYREGGEECSGIFQYQSCTGSMNDGSFSGFIEFVPGTISEPTGESFRAEVRPFLLTSRPDFLY